MRMSSIEQLAPPPVDSQPVENPSPIDSYSSIGSNWDRLGDLMIDLGGDSSVEQPPQQHQQQHQQQQQQQLGPLKMQNSAACENLAPLVSSTATLLTAKPECDKGLTLKMKIKRKSKNDEKHEITMMDSVGNPAAERLLRQAVGYPFSPDESASCPAAAAPAAKKSRQDKDHKPSSRHASDPSNSACGGKRDAASNTATVGTGIEPDSLGPCDSGTSISLDGIVWLETDTGVLVVNVTWRGRTYVGTLLDSSRHDFSPPVGANGAAASADDSSGDSTTAAAAAAAGGSAASRWCNQQLQAQLAAAMQSNGHQPHHHHQHHGGRGRGNRRRGGRPVARQLPLALNGNGAVPVAGGGSDLPHIRCPEPGCDKRFAQLQALKWHSLSQHSQRLQQPQPPAVSPTSDLREEKSLDGSSVFKVPPPQAVVASSVATGSAKAAGPGTVTVSKTCPVPTPPQAHSGSSSRAGQHQLKSSSSAAGRAAASSRRSGCGAPSHADPVSPAYSDISDEGGAPVLEREDSDSKPLLTRSLSSGEATRTRSLPPQPPPAPAASAAAARTAASSAAAPPAAPRTPTTPSSSAGGGAPPAKPSLGHSPSEGGDATAHSKPPQPPPPPPLISAPAAPSSAPVTSSAGSAAAHQLASRAMFQPSPRRSSQPQPQSPRFRADHHQLPPPLPPPSASSAAAAAAMFDYHLLSGMPPHFHLPGMEALTSYAAINAGRQQQQQQQQQQQAAHKIHELSRNSSPRPSPPIHQHHPTQQQQQHQQQQLHHHHHPGHMQMQPQQRPPHPLPPMPPPQQHQQHHQQQQQHQQHHFMDPFGLPFSLASQMMQHAAAAASSQAAYLQQRK